MSETQRRGSKIRPLLNRWAVLKNAGSIRPDVKFQQCPIKASMGVLGKKWTMLIIRDVGFRHIDRFNRLLESIQGITPRVLSMRLRELEHEGFIEMIEDKQSPMITRWALTEKGEDTLPILVRFMAFGAKWYATQVFQDKTPRLLTEVFTNPEAQQIVQQLYES